jgi:O-antigen ligase
MLATSLPGLFRRRAAAALEAGALISVALSVAILAGILRLGDAHPGNPAPSMAHLDYTLILALVSLLALIRVLYGGHYTRSRLAWFAGFAVTTAGLLFNIGRSGQLGFLVGLAVLLVHWARVKSTRRAGLAVVLAALGVAVVFGFSLPALQRMNDARLELGAALEDNDFESNIGGRVAAVHVASRMVRENPVLGTGIGANMPRFREVLDTELPELKPAIYWYRHFHNQYTQVATELGLVGLVSLLWIFWEIVRGPYRSRELGAAGLVISAVYLVGFLGEPFLHKQIPLVAFGLLAGMLSAAQLDDAAAEDN